MLHSAVENVATFEHLNLDLDTQSNVRVINHRFAEETMVENFFDPGLYISILGKCYCETSRDGIDEKRDFSYQYIVASVEKGSNSEIYFPSNSTWQTFSIMLPLSELNGFVLPQANSGFSSPLSKDTFAETGPVPKDILHCCEAVWNCPFEGLERQLFIKAKALEVLSLFLHKRREENRDEISSRMMKLGKALSYIQTHLSQDWSLTSLARLAGSNPTYVKQDIKKLMSVGFKEWLTQVRVQAACDQLAGSDSITEIAHNIGFRSQAHFATLFKHEIGISPSSYRKSLHMKH